MSMKHWPPIRWSDLTRNQLLQTSSKRLQSNASDLNHRVWRCLTIGFRCHCEVRKRLCLCTRVIAFCLQQPWRFVYFWNINSFSDVWWRCSVVRASCDCMAVLHCPKPCQRGRGATVAASKTYGWQSLWPFVRNWSRPILKQRTSTNM